MVSAEGKGLDWVLEVHVGGDRKKDAARNVARYARLGIPECFLYDRASNRLAVYRLAAPDAKVDTAVLPNHGLYESRVLDLEVQVEHDRLRFFSGSIATRRNDCAKRRSKRSRGCVQSSTASSGEGKSFLVLDLLALEDVGGGLVGRLPSADRRDARVLSSADGALS